MLKMHLESMQTTQMQNLFFRKLMPWQKNIPDQYIDLAYAIGVRLELPFLKARNFILF